MSLPQIIITLAPDGSLIAELPGLNGMRRKCPIRPGKVETDLLHILQSQLTGQTRIGEDGAPDQFQLKHWDKHGIICTDPKCKRKTPHSHNSDFSDPSCPFCISEGRFEPGYNRERAIKGLSENEALKLGLLYHGFKQSTTNPDIWNKKNMAAVRLLPNGKIFNSKNEQWSKSNHLALIADGKLHALNINFAPQEFKPHKHGGTVVRKLVKRVTNPITPQSKINTRNLVANF